MKNSLHSKFFVVLTFSDEIWKSYQLYTDFVISFKYKGCPPSTLAWFKRPNNGKIRAIFFISFLLPLIFEEHPNYT